MANQVDLSTGYYPNPTIGRPLSNANIYVGVIDLDPEDFPKQISVLQEDGTTVEVGQPITTSAGGVPQYNGSPVTILVDGSYSIKVTDKNGSQIYYVPKNLEGLDNLLEGLQPVDSIADLRAITYTPEDGQVVNVLGYATAGDGGGRELYWDSTSTSTDDGVDVFKATAIGTGRFKSLDIVDRINIKQAGILGSDSTADTAQFKAILAAFPNGIKIVSDKQTLAFDATLAIPENFHLDFGGSTIVFDARGSLLAEAGFFMASNTSIKNIQQGYIIFDNTISNAFVTCGLFYGVGNSTRAKYVGVIPDILSIGDFSSWDAPTDIVIENIHSDISGVAHDTVTDYFGAAFIFMTNFVKRITINNVTAKGLAVYTDYLSSYVSTEGGILDDSNYFNVVRFEWGNFVSPSAHASGSSLKVSNIRGEGLRLHNHSAVVSMGNAHQYDIKNITGVNTGQVFYAASSGTASEQSSETEPFAVTMSSVSGIKGYGLYVWDENSHLCGGINVAGTFDGSTETSPLTNLKITNFNLRGLTTDDLTAPTKKPSYGVVVGDASWAGDVRFLSLENGIATSFDIGLSMGDCRSIMIIDSIFAYNGSRGVSVASGDLIPSLIRFSRCSFYHNNTDGYTDYAVNDGVGVTLFRSLGVVFDQCNFGDQETAAGSETQLHSVFLRDGEVRNTTFRDCVFYNYKDSSSYDIYTNSSDIKYRIDNCMSAINTDGRLKVAFNDVGYGFNLLATGRFNYASTTLTTYDLKNCTITRASIGRYVVVFDTTLKDDSYFVTPIQPGLNSTAGYYVQYRRVSSTQFEILVRNSVGSLVDPSTTTENIEFLVFRVNDLLQKVNI